MGTNVIYNGIELHNVITRDFQQTLKYDDSGTDLLYHEFKVRIEGIMHVQSVPNCPAWIAGEGGSGPTGHVAFLYDSVNRLLAQPRGVFEMTVGGKRILRAVPSALNKQDPDRDVDNGPKPSDVSVTHIAGDQVFRVAFTIVVAKVHCSSPGYTIGVLNNRWSVAESMDDHFRVTRSIRGRLRLADSGTPAHFYKALVVPGLETGFRRASIEYQVDKDGLTCDYQVVDQQVHTAAPWPATHISGTHTESTSDGVTFQAECAIRLEGPVNADKRLMLAQAMAIVDTKLGVGFGGQQGQDYLVLHAALIDHIGDIPAVEARYRIQHVWGENEREKLANLRSEVLGAPIELEALNGHQYKNTVSQTPALYGVNSHGAEGEVRDPAAALFVMHCYLQTPCDNNHAIARGEFEPDEESESAGYEPGTTVTGYEAELPKNEDGDYYHESTYEAMYLSARLMNRYFWQYSRAQLPIAASADDEDEDTSVVINLARPQARREVRFIAERVGEYPKLPKANDQYQDGEIKGTLLRYWDREEAPRLAADGRKLIYTMEAYYLYALNRPPKDDELTRVGVLPFSSVEQTAAAVQRNKLHDSRLNLGEELA